MMLTDQCNEIIIAIAIAVRWWNVDHARPLIDWMPLQAADKIVGRMILQPEDRTVSAIRTLQPKDPTNHQSQSLQSQR